MRARLRRKKFVKEYLKTGVATTAAKRAGYSAKTARQQGSSLLTKPDVQAAVKKGIELADVTAERVLLEIARIALSDLSECFDQDGNLRPVQEWSEDVRRAIGQVEVVTRTMPRVGKKPAVVDYVHKLKPHDKNSALGLLAKHHNLLKEKIELAGEITYKWRD